MTHSPFWQNLFRPPHKQKQHICDLWLATPIFTGISHRQCRSLVAEMAVRRYQIDEAIFKQGDVGIGTALIIKGSVQICSGNKVLATMEEGDFFGEVALVIGAPRTATAIAHGDVEIVFFLRTAPGRQDHAKPGSSHGQSFGQYQRLAGSHACG